MSSYLFTPSHSQLWLTHSLSHLLIHSVIHSFIHLCAPGLWLQTFHLTDGRKFNSCCDKLPTNHSHLQHETYSFVRVYLNVCWKNLHDLHPFILSRKRMWRTTLRRGLIRLLWLDGALRPVMEPNELSEPRPSVMDGNEAGSHESGSDLIWLSDTSAST